MKIHPRTLQNFAQYAATSLLLYGAGLGVPVFTILLGFPAGALLARQAIREEDATLSRYCRVIQPTMLTFLLMIALSAVVWGFKWPLLWTGAPDPAGVGVLPLLPVPTMGYGGWLVAMIVFGPFLQLIATLAIALFTFGWSSQQKTAAA